MKFFLILLFILFSNFPAYAEKNNNINGDKFETECKLLEAEISLLLFYADNKFMNKPELISKYLLSTLVIMIPFFQLFHLRINGSVNEEPLDHHNHLYWRELYNLFHQ